VEQVLGDVAPEDRCQCQPEPLKSLLRWLLGR
jgi:hypothetical protein